VSAPARDDAVHATQHLGARLDFARVHGEHDARAPVEKAGTDCVADGADDFAGQAAHALASFVVGKGAGDFFEEDGDALQGFVAQGALMGGELEGVGDFVGEGGYVFVSLEGWSGGCEVLGFEEAGRGISDLFCFRA
jgi:hypothetical protein